jgi:hypothetical protein
MLANPLIKRSLVRNQKLIQLSILIGTLGMVTCFMGLYPGITGAEPQSGIGVLQIMTILVGMAFIIVGALLFVKVNFYSATAPNLAQQIALRLCFTGLLIAAAVGFADLLGYGSHPPDDDAVPVLGAYQAAGMVFGYFVSAVGVLLYALAGPTNPPYTEAT